MIGYVLRRESDGKFATHETWSVDVLEGLRFAREQDAKNYMRAGCLDSNCLVTVVPVMMSEQWPAELQAIRDAITEAERLERIMETAKSEGSYWHLCRARRAATRAKDRASGLCYDLFKRSILRTPNPPAKVALPAKAQG